MLLENCVWPIDDRVSGLWCRLERGVMGFRYLAQSSTVSLEGVDDGEELRNTLDAMHIIGLSEGECESVLQVRPIIG